MKHARVHRSNDYYMNATMRKLQMQLEGEHLCRRTQSPWMKEYTVVYALDLGLKDLVLARLFPSLFTI